MSAPASVQIAVDIRMSASSLPPMHVRPLPHTTWQQAIWASMCYVAHHGAKASPSCRRSPGKWLYVPITLAAAAAIVERADDGRQETESRGYCP